MAKPKVYSVQPRFKTGDLPGGWSIVDGIFRMGLGVDTMVLPPYGTEYRDMWLSVSWQDEPMTAGALSTWVEKAQTTDWKVTGGRNTARAYAGMLTEADNGRGWTHHEGLCALDFLCTDKGQLEELGRESARSTVGRVMGLQHVDSARTVKMGKPGFYWRYYPERGNPVDLPDDNVIQVQSMPQGRDRYRGYGYCAMSRLYDAKHLMLGYITYFRQEIGDIPPELIAIINGLPATTVEDSLRKYKLDREGAGNTVYPKVWWLGSDDPAAPVSLDVRQMTVPTKSFNHRDMTEWWIKTIALNTGEDVGEFWLLQTGESKTVQSIQALKSKGKGVARYLQEKERRYNIDIFPYGTRFEYDNTDDEQDRARADILAINIGNLAKMADMGVQRQELVYDIEEIRQLSVMWNVIPAEMGAEDLPSVVGSTLKSLYAEDVWVVDRSLKEYRVEPILRGREARKAEDLYHWFGMAYGLMNGHNGAHQHQYLEEVKL